MDFVIMAGGIGSRFGGLKQVEPIDEHGNFLIDYTIFDAIRCGFEKVIFVINKNHHEIFENTIGRRVSAHIKVEYCFQENPYEAFRNKPLGTAHAVLSAKNKIDGGFVVVNADDFYGYESIKLAKNCLQNLQENEFAMVSFKAKNTISHYGAVKRGVCEIENGLLKKIEECRLSCENEKIVASPLNSPNQSFHMTGEEVVSMNLWVFPKIFLQYLEEDFNEFIKDENNIKNKEFFLTFAVENSVKKHGSKVKVKLSNAEWFGLTYRQDKEEIVKKIQLMKNNKIYPQNLWGEN